MKIRQRASGIEAVAVGANQPGLWSRKAERAGTKSVGHLKRQAGNFDPGMEALKGAAVAGERKVASKIGLRSALSRRRVCRH
jgi:hypothetical protein